jgi:hypothetical protein
MEHLGPGTGRERSPEDIAQEIIDSSDEGFDDLDSTEIVDGDDAEPDYYDDESPREIYGDEADFDDGGDWSEF